MKKRIVSLLLAAILLSLTVSCSDGGGNDETEAAANDPATTTETETDIIEEDLTPAQQRALIPDELPERDFEGRSYVFGVEEIKCYEILSEELTGEATNDAVYDRNIRIEDRFNVKIETLPTAEPYNNLKTVVTSGTYSYDVAGFVNYQSSIPIMGKVVYNWNEIPFVDLQKPWYNQLANDPATINGKLFAVNSDLSISTLQYTYGMFFNYNIMDRYGYTSQNLYDKVFDGSWTIDNMRSITTGIFEDINGDGKLDRNDVCGYSVFLGLNTTDVWLAALDLDVLQINSDGTFEVTYFNEKTVSALEKAIALSYDPTGTFINTTDWRDVPKAFSEGKIAMTQLYFGETTESLGEMDDTYGILPLPKFDENQAGYYTNAWDQFSVFAVPLTVADADKELTGIIFEALSAESYKTVFPAYYDQALKSRYSAEPATAEIIDIIMAGRKLDFSFQFGTNLQSLPYQFREMLKAKSTDVASKFKKTQKSLNKAFQKVIDLYFEG